MILIIANREDIHTRFVLAHLAELGVQASLLDLEEVPAGCTMAAQVVRTRDDGAWQARIGEVALEGAQTVWLRRLAKMRASEGLRAEDQEFAISESKALLAGMAQLLEDRRWINPLWSAFVADRGNGKLGQLEHARQVGMTVPRTLMTNDPEAARAFVRSCDDEGAIYKPFLPPTRKVYDDGERQRYGTVYTTKIDESALGKLDGVRHAPCIFQELVPKRYDLRVIVMGTRVFATAIHSQDDERSALDFRRHYALDQTPYSIHELPDEIARACVALTRRLGLRFGAADFVLTPDGRYVFLEINQQGQWLWLENMTGQPLLANFCQFLIQGDDFECDAAVHEPGLPELPELPPRPAPSV